MNKQTQRSSQSLILARVQGKITFFVFCLFALILFLLIYLNYLHSKQRILSSFDHAFSQRALALDESIGDIVNHVLRMKTIADDHLAQNIDDDLFNQTRSKLEEISTFYPGKNFHFYHHGERLGQQIITGAIFGLGSLEKVDREYIKRLLMSLSLLDMQKALHDNNPNVVLSYYLSRKHYFSESYPYLPFDKLMADFDDVYQLINHAYEVYDDFAPRGKNPDGRYFWTKPYFDRAGNGMMVTCGIPVYDREEYIGVLGADVLLGFLDQHTFPIDILPGQMILASEYQQIISASDLSYAKETDVIYLKNFLPFKINDPHLFRGDQTQVEIPGQIIFRKPLKNAPWTLLYILTEQQLRNSLLAEIKISIFIVLLILIILPIGYAYIDKQFIKPGIKAEQDLETLNRELDHKVRERTQELTIGKEELTASEEKFRTLFESSRDAIILLDPDKGYLDCNPATLAMFNLPSKQEFLFLTSSDISPEYQPNGSLSADLAKKEIDKTFEKGSNFFEWLHKSTDGRQFPATVLTTRMELNGKLILQGTIRDITQNKQAEEALKNAQNYISNIINSMPSVLISVDTDGRITQWNHEAELITGLSQKDAVSRSFTKVYPLLSDKMEWVCKAIRNREVQKNTQKPRQQAGEIRYEDVIVYPLVANCVQGAVIRIDDVTERVRMEELMVQSEKMLSVGGLAAGMAHEINNPLAGIIQTCEVLTNRLTDTTIPANLIAAKATGVSMEAIQDYMEKRGILKMTGTIRESGRRLAQIVDNMLSFARKSEAQISSCALEKILEKTLELATTDYDLKKQYDFKQIEIKRQYEANLPPIPCEEVKIQQVLLNILRNGAQAMQEAGKENPRFIIRLRLEKAENMICIEIEDNGPGMDDKTRNRIFEPFFTTKPAGVGTGLGLSVSYFIITENHKGTMTVESQPGSGTKFIIHLPYAGK